MPRAGSDLHLGDFEGGLNVRDHPLDIAGNQGSAIADYRHDGRGLRKRVGDTAIVYNSFGTSQVTQMIATDGSRVWISTAAGGLYTSTFALPTAVAAASASGSTPNLIKANANGGQGPYYLASPTAMLQCTTAAASLAAWTAVSGTLPTNAAAMIYAQNRVIVANPTVYAGATDVKSTVIASIAGNPRGWDTAAGAWAVELDPGDGETILALAQFGPVVLVFKETKTYVIYDLDTGANRLLESAGGIAAGGKRTLCRTPQGIIYLHRDGRVMRTDGSTSKELSHNLQPFIASYLAVTAGSACFYDNSYWLHMGNRILELDLEKDVWWRHTAIDLQAIVTVRDNNSFSEVILLLEGLVANIGGNDGPRISKFMVDASLFESYSNGTFITPLYRTGLLDAGNSDRKRIGQITLDGAGGIGNIVNVAAYSDVVFDNSSFDSPIWIPGTVIGATPSQVSIPARTPVIGGKPVRNLLVEVRGANYLNSINVRVNGRGR